MIDSNCVRSGRPPVPQSSSIQSTAAKDTHAYAHILARDRELGGPVANEPKVRFGALPIQLTDNIGFWLKTDV